MKIGIIGAGSMGQILARNLARLGHQVSIANSRGPESLTSMAAEIGATPVSVVDAPKAGEIVILAIPTKAVPDPCQCSPNFNKNSGDPMKPLGSAEIHSLIPFRAPHPIRP